MRTGGTVGTAGSGARTAGRTRVGGSGESGGGSEGGTITAGAETATAGGGGGATIAAGAEATAASATPTANTPRHTEHRARTPPAGTFAGSTRKTVEQVGQVTFMDQSPSSRTGSWRRSTTKTDPGSVLA
jgi:hypothetical protein